MAVKQKEVMVTVGEINSLRAAFSLFQQETKSTRKDLKELLLACANLDESYKSLNARVSCLEELLRQQR